MHYLLRDNGFMLPDDTSSKDGASYVGDVSGNAGTPVVSSHERDLGTKGIEGHGISSSSRAGSGTQGIESSSSGSLIRTIT